MSRKYNNPCSICGIDKDLPREPVFLDNNVLSYSNYLDEKCVGCGSQKTGWTLSSLKHRNNRIYNSGKRQGALEELKRIELHCQEDIEIIEKRIKELEELKS